MGESTRCLVAEFLAFVEPAAPMEPGGASAETLTQTLQGLLDQLACAVHADPPETPLADADAPRREYAAVRSTIAERFAHLGLYRAAGTSPDDEFLVGDAIDDLTDIAIDLSEVIWLWEHAGAATALWQLRFGFESHWGSHLRSLQWYLHEL